MINVLLTMRVVDNAGYPERRDAIAHDFPSYLEGFGVRPILVPNVTRDPEGYIDATGAKGVILSGGNDPAFSGSDDGFSEERDATELRLLTAAVHRNLPVLGVCRGLQVINHFLGGEVSRLDGSHVARNHRVRFQRPAFGQPAESEMTVNSFHDLGVRMNGLASGLSPFAVSLDGIVEGAENMEKRLTAVQWHPERTSPSAAFDRNMMTAWISTCDR
jgi:putative glutamine amidotransferase